jgi:hypothetical protein
MLFETITVCCENHTERTLVGDNEELTERYTGGEWTVRRPVVTNNIVTLGGLMVIVPAVGLKVRGF